MCTQVKYELHKTKPKYSNQVQLITTYSCFVIHKVNHDVINHTLLKMR